MWSFLVVYWTISGHIHTPVHKSGSSLEIYGTCAGPNTAGHVLSNFQIRYIFGLVHWSVRPINVPFHAVNVTICPSKTFPFSCPPFVPNGSFSPMVAEACTCVIWWNEGVLLSGSLIVCITHTQPEIVKWLGCWCIGLLCLGFIQCVGVCVTTQMKHEMYWGLMQKTRLRYMLYSYFNDIDLSIYSGYRKTPPPFKMFTICCLTAWDENTSNVTFSGFMYTHSNPQYPSRKWTLKQ